MASQQILFAETIAGMKKAIKRKAFESDSDSDVENRGSRGGKLKKRARFARLGQLVPTQGPSAYKESVDYAGVRRAIIHRNPPLVDEEGYEIDSDDDDDRVQEAEMAAAELNPYANIRLEHVLAPLTASTNLPTHPTLSKPFSSKTLTRLVSQSCELMHKENHSLWRIRHLWTALCGDGTWMPCGLMCGPNDMELYKDNRVTCHLQSLARASGADASPPGMLNGDALNEHVDSAGNAAGNAAAGAGDHQERPEEVQGGADVSMRDASPADQSNGKSKEADGAGSSEAFRERKGGDQRPEGRGGHDGDNGANDGQAKGRAEDRQDVATKDGDATADNQPAPGRVEMDSLATATGLDQTLIHPMFLTPADARPDRDLGLPEHEAEDIRRLLALYVQKQEEVCRGTSRLHQGLLRAERLRKDVLHWSKAEAHCGANRDMSDGEDWYDKEEWGLSEDLKKGQDEEEEDTTTAGKKTRNRR